LTGVFRSNTPITPNRERKDKEKIFQVKVKGSKQQSRESRGGRTKYTAIHDLAGEDRQSAKNQMINEENENFPEDDQASTRKPKLLNNVLESGKPERGG